jgi:thiol-disulfide isomerase/thioredoxin
MQHQAHLIALAALCAGAAWAADTPEARDMTPSPVPVPPPLLTTVAPTQWEARILAPRRGRVVVVNFWATWCPPCLEELPALKRAQERFAGLPVEVVLVSADFGESAPKNIKAALAKLGVPFESYLRKAGDPEELIDLVDPKWQGDLPYTVVYDAKGQPAARLYGAQDEAAFAAAIEKGLLASGLKPRAPAKAPGR